LQMSLITCKASKTANKHGQQRQESHCWVASWLQSPQQRSNINSDIFTSTESKDRRASSSASYTVPSLFAAAARTMHPSKASTPSTPPQLMLRPNFKSNVTRSPILISTHELQQPTPSLAYPPFNQSKRACRSLSMPTTPASPQLTMRNHKGAQALTCQPLVSPCA
jgi:hypothetical protein